MSPPAASPRLAPSRQTSLRLVLLLVATGLVLGFILRGDRTLPGDRAMLEAVQSVEFAGLATVIQIVDLTGSTGGGIIVACVLALTGIVMGVPRYALQVALVVTLRLAGEIFKPTFGSPRPPGEYLRDPDRALTTMGYPSGHAFTWTCMSGMLVVLAYTLSRSTRWRRAAIATAVTIVVIGAFTRPWLGLHWPYDMFGGMFFGAAAVLIALTVLPIRSGHAI